MDMHELLGRYGTITRHRTREGRSLTILPTCTVPIESLVEENWDLSQRRITCGNYRNVRWIRYKGSSLFVKGPEQVFTKSQKKLQKGEIWWGGPRSGEEPIFVPDRFVDEQVEWEAAYLQELLEKGIRAEVPQALVEFEGQKELVVKDVRTTEYGIGFGYEGGSICDAVKDRTDLVPIDCKSHNFLPDREGNTSIIDVNRWEWPQYAAGWRMRLLDTILAQAGYD